VGRWCDALRWLAPREGLRPAEEFANYPRRVESIQKFTRKYGPLFIEPKPRGQFEFLLEHWHEAQDGFRFLWQLVASGMTHGSWGQLGARDDLETVVAFGDAGGWRLVPGRGDELVYVDRKLTYRTGTVFRFLVLDLLSREPVRLRKCKKPDCEHPYFVARHLNQSFCSDRCAAWGQSEWKRLWWTRKGKEWRAEQRKGSTRKRR
jgi:hypothetical protein